LKTENRNLDIFRQILHDAFSKIGKVVTLDLQVVVILEKDEQTA
jgi:hypothetical protein